VLEVVEADERLGRPLDWLGQLGIRRLIDPAHCRFSFPFVQLCKTTMQPTRHPQNIEKKESEIRTPLHLQQNAEA